MTFLSPFSSRGLIAGGAQATSPTLPGRSDGLLDSAMEYAVDAGQRAVLFWDAMRQAGNAFVEHEEEGCPPVLFFKWEMVVDGRHLPRPVNYALVRIQAPEGAAPLDPKLRPFVIIDPRAGHGAGIGGFKNDSQVGVALRRGHPVYFVIFFRDPEPGQTILDITAAEGTFLRRIHELHPEAPKSVVIGNCQGGWAVMMLGAAQPELTGAIVLNGAPLSYWAGERGRNPMRYFGGLAGGSWPASLLADLGNGKFDGANLVMNFEALSPGNTWFKKYYNLFANVDSETPRFLEFERWWGGYFLMNRDEIHWIVENLFIGDRFARGEIHAGGGATFNMRAIRSPVVVFASAGDNITPPGQALRWIADVYRDEQEIKTLGQTIVYLLHEDIGHLGIFVSGAVALKEHSEIAETLQLIDSVAPGLYEMVITHDTGGKWQVELQERSMAHIRAHSEEATNEAFPAVARISALNQHLYDVFAAPLVQRMANERTAELGRQFHPLRLRRTLLSDHNPLMAPVAPLAEEARRRRAPAAPNNPFLAWERAWADMVERSFDAYRDMRDAWFERSFHATYEWLATLGIARVETPAEVPANLLAEAPEVRLALSRMAEGGYAEAVVRMMILLAQARGGVRRDRLVRSSAMMRETEPFASMTPEARQTLIRTQTVICAMAPTEALETLPNLLPKPVDRRRALAAVEGVAGPEAELGDPATAMLQRLRTTLGGGNGRGGAAQPVPFHAAAIPSD
ncbi:MAG: Poly(3-hydroxyalkanoate) synthetase [uncultured Acetobacteraceae bacterium]|uniref:Poly(3-hydroxyalkanoate) synthetase n=1 Tax=uncultured Acetobacteraceae bacterium TaxID=169975 RepID=A0A6J4I3Q8_9PROT|nr:MAG: Poly(3-hydroxyalkanoate) synthetase [uncultured Acetobacteraceae bacterium]